MKQKILVTGGNGYIGSHTVIELLNHGFEVHILDNLYNSYIENITRIENIIGDSIKFVEIDICDFLALKKFFLKNKYDAVIHFAAHKSVNESINKPLKYINTNINGTINLCNAMINAGCYNLIFSSSAAVYDTNNLLPFTEESFLDSNNTYGESKIICEKILQRLSRTKNPLRSISLRYFNPAGAHSSGMIGENPKNTDTNLFPQLLEKIFNKDKNFYIYGNDYETKDGTGIRDFIHVMDLAEAHVLALKRLLNLQNENYEIFNVGTGIGYSVFEVITTFEQIISDKIDYEVKNRRDGDLPICFADNTKIKTAFNWVPKKNLKEICIDAYKWKNYSFHKNI
tara:strand:+ start:208 stop:1230 length:1023 start_codon:yes stop_codon:yes gene_type:complete